MTSYVVDSSVILERIIRTSPLKARVERLFEEAKKGRVSLLVPLPTLSEVLYAASRIYSLAGVERPDEEAYTLVEWVKSRCRLATPSEARSARRALRLFPPFDLQLATEKPLPFGAGKGRQHLLGRLIEGLI